jgi:hypothetical protein
MCLFKSPKAPPPPPPEGAETQRERRRIAARKGQFVSPYANGQMKSLLDR